MGTPEKSVLGIYALVPHLVDLEPIDAKDFTFILTMLTFKTWPWHLIKGRSPEVKKNSALEPKHIPPKVAPFQVRPLNNNLGFMERFWEPGGNPTTMLMPYAY